MKTVRFWNLKIKRNRWSFGEAKGLYMYVGKREAQFLWKNTPMQLFTCRYKTFFFLAICSTCGANVYYSFEEFEKIYIDIGSDTFMRFNSSKQKLIPQNVVDRCMCVLVPFDVIGSQLRHIHHVATMTLADVAYCLTRHIRTCVYSGDHTSLPVLLEREPWHQG